MAIRGRLADLVAALGKGAPDDLRVQLTDAEGVELAGELLEAGHEVRFPEALAVTRDGVVAVGELPDDPDAILGWAKRKSDALAAFWDVFEGEVVDGCHVIRRRA